MTPTTDAPPPGFSPLPPGLEALKRAAREAIEAALAARRREEEEAVCSAWEALCACARADLGEEVWAYADAAPSPGWRPGNSQVVELCLPGHWPVRALYRRHGEGWERAEFDRPLQADPLAGPGGKPLWLAGTGGDEWVCTASLGAALHFAEFTQEDYRRHEAEVEPDDVPF